MRLIRFMVLGDPVPQGSKKAFVNKYTQRAQIVDQGGARLKSWRLSIVEEAAAHDPFEGAISVSLWFALRQPKRPKASRPIVRPDVDKLARAVLDALQSSGLIQDDAQVVRLVAEKWYGEVPKVEVEVKELS